MSPSNIWNKAPLRVANGLNNRTSIFGCAASAAPFADRLELCDDLPSEGWTPTPALIAAAHLGHDGIVRQLIEARAENRTS